MSVETCEAIDDRDEVEEPRPSVATKRTDLVDDDAEDADDRELRRGEQDPEEALDLRPAVVALGGWASSRRCRHAILGAAGSAAIVNARLTMGQMFGSRPARTPGHWPARALQGGQRRSRRPDRSARRRPRRGSAAAAGPCRPAPSARSRPTSRASASGAITRRDVLNGIVRRVDLVDRGVEGRGCRRTGNVHSATFVKPVAVVSAASIVGLLVLIPVVYTQYWARAWPWNEAGQPGRPVGLELVDVARRDVDRDPVVAGRGLADPQQAVGRGRRC